MFVKHVISHFFIESGTQTTYQPTSSTLAWKHNIAYEGPDTNTPGRSWRDRLLPSSCSVIRPIITLCRDLVKGSRAERGEKGEPNLEQKDIKSIALPLNGDSNKVRQRRESNVLITTHGDYQETMRTTLLGTKPDILENKEAAAPESLKSVQDNSTSTSDLTTMLRIERMFSGDEVDGYKKRERPKKSSRIRIRGKHEFSHKFVPKHCDYLHEHVFSSSYKPRLQETVGVIHPIFNNNNNKVTVAAATTPCEKEIEKRSVDF